MKKLFILVIATVCTLASMATDYSGRLTVTVNGETSSQDGVNISVTPDGNTYTLTLNNFILNDGETMIPVGNIVLSGVNGTTSGEVTALAVNRDINITAGDAAGVESWMGPLLGIVPINMVARFTGDYLVTSIDIDMQASIGQTIHVLFSNDTQGTHAAKFQLPNGDFEGWKASSGEPDRWHGFKSAKGSWASMAKGTLASSAEVRPGSAGSKSAVVTSGSILGVINNGTMTNGQLQAGSTAAANTANHSEMNKSATATDKNGDPFYMPIYAKPDAIKLWLKFSQGTASSAYPYATVSTIIFDGSYYQDPEDKTYTNVAAKAGDQKITTGGWRELDLPFDYDSYAANQASAEAILITVSTNATPGKGSNGDKVWVDDMTLVYRADITGIALKNSALEGFTFDADQHHYDLTYEGDFALTADDFDVTVDGRSAIVVKNVEDLGNGNYRVAIAAVTPDLLTGNLYTYNFNKKRITGDVTGDGLVNVADVNALVSIILGLSEKNELADVNGDGVVNVADINALVSIILGK